MKKLIVALTLLLTLAACAGSGTRTVAGVDTVLANTDGNSVVIVRKTGYAGVVPRISIFLDGEKVATLANDEVISLQVPPGERVLEAQFEGPSIIGVKRGEARFTNDGTAPQYFALTLDTTLFSATLQLRKVAAGYFASTAREGI
ncbi:MAG: hypothetical protein AAGL24_18380 [Pseudomonadota bacterium]